MLFLVWAEMVLVLVACWYWRKTSLKAERLRARISAALEILRPQAKWDGAIPEGQGLPDGETYAHYVNAMGYRDLVEILEGTEAAEAKEG